MARHETADEIIATFRSPWARSIWWLTLLSLAVLVGLAMVAVFAGPAGSLVWLAVILVPTVVVLAAVGFFTIRRYDLTPGHLLVRRLGGTTHVELDGLQSAVADPDAMEGARRTFGRGKMSLFFNTYENERLGDFWAFGRQDRRAVVLRYPNQVVVVTPHDPQRMVAELERIIAGAPDAPHPE